MVNLSANIPNTLTVSCEKSKIVSFVSSIMKDIVVFTYRLRFPVNQFVLLLLDQH